MGSRKKWSGSVGLVISVLLAAGNAQTTQQATAQQPMMAMAQFPQSMYSNPYGMQMPMPYMYGGMGYPPMFMAQAPAVVDSAAAPSVATTAPSPAAAPAPPTPQFSGTPTTSTDPLTGIQQVQFPSATQQGRDVNSTTAADGISARSVDDAQNSTISKSELFNFSGHPASLQQLGFSSKVTRFQIWWLVGQKVLPSVKDRQIPTYITLMPHPYQQGLPAANISLALMSPLPRPEVLKALIQEAPGMLPSQLAVLSQRLRLSDSSTLRNIIGSANPSVLLGKFNPRLVKNNIRQIIRNIMTMPESSRFGSTSIHAKLLPINMLTQWIQSVNITTWTAKDLLGQSEVGSKNELQLALPGITCQEIKNLAAPVDVLYVADAYRQELYNLRTVQDVPYPMRLRKCFLEEVIEYLTTKPMTDGHVLDGFTVPEIRAVGGEILTGIPTAALKASTLTTQAAIIKEIAKLDPITLATFAPLSKLHYYADTLFSSMNAADDFGPDQFAPSTIPSIKPAALKLRSLDLGDQEGQGVQDQAAQSTTSSLDQSRQATANQTAEATAVSPDQARQAASGAQSAMPAMTSMAMDQTTTANLTSDAQVPAAPRTKRSNTADPNAEKLGGLFCYSTMLLKNSDDKDALRIFLEQREDIGEKTCCMDPIMRGGWSKLLKKVFGQDITQWSEFDLLAAGDLLVSLQPDEIAKIPLETLAKVTTSIIKQAGFFEPVQVAGKTDPLTFSDMCQSMMGKVDAQEYLNAERALMKRLAQAAQWMLISEDIKTNSTDLKITCDGLNIAGPAAIGYTADDIKTMDPEDMFDCVETLGLLNFDDATRSDLLQFFKTTFQLSSRQLSIYTLLEIGNFVSALKPEDAVDMPLSLPRASDSLSVLGFQIKSADTLKAIAAKFISDNRGQPGIFGTSRSPDLRVVMRSLGNVICKVNDNTLASVFDSDPTLLIDASPDLGSIESCGFSTLSILANNAIKPSNYGPPENWSQEDVRTLGVIVAGLTPDLVSRIPPISMEGLSPLAIKSIPTQSLLALTPDQIRNIPSDAAAAVDLAQTKLMSSPAKDALQSSIAITADGLVLDSRITTRGTAKNFDGFGGGDFLKPTTPRPSVASTTATPDVPDSSDLSARSVDSQTDPAPVDDRAAATASALNSTMSAVNGTDDSLKTLDARSVNGTDLPVPLNVTSLDARNATDSATPIETPLDPKSVVDSATNGTSATAPEVINTRETDSGASGTVHPEGETGVKPTIKPAPTSAAFTISSNASILYLCVFFSGVLAIGK